MLSVIDAKGHKTSYTYDALNRVIGITDAANGITSYTYDAGDHVTGVEDPRGLVTTYAWDGLGQLWRQVSPDTGATAFQYDAYGRLSYKQLASGMPEYFGYDALNRMVSRGTSEYGSQSFTWDSCTHGIGRLCVSTTGTDSVGYSYSPEGWITGRSFNISGSPSYSLGYSYDNMGHLSVVDYPDGNQALYYYTDGAVSQVNLQVGAYLIGGVDDITYRPMDLAMSGWTSNNGLTNTIVYDSDLRPTSITIPGVESLTFSYDTANRITGITNGMDGSQSETLGYDALNRLNSAVSTADSESYQYDADGNRTSQVINGVASSFAYPSTSNRLTSVSGGLNGTFGYNANGDTVTVNGLAAYTYDPFERLVNTAGTAFTISAEGQRLEKTSAADGTTYFAPDASGPLLAEDQNGTWMDYVWLNGRLVTVMANGGVYPVAADQTGRPLALTHPATKAILWESENLPFDRDVTANHWGNFNLGFPGQYYDQEDNLWYNGARDYNETLGRYMESDPIGLVGGVNTYAYSNDNPIINVDGLGLDSAVFYTEPQYQMSLSGTGLQLPDVYLFEIGLGPVSISATYTSYGDAFVGISGNPTQIAQGKGLQVGGVAIAAGYVKGCDHSRQTINNIVSSFSGGASYYDGVGGGFSKNASGTIFYGGVGAGQFSYGTGYNQYTGNIFGH
ncbi:MAG: hypothetical protein OJF61_001896 [Rhodanobacteraceae bacterium]|nr:MAG: hypothetical protein OJF61_001896 [Rhodanobacteraceae bacterium]